MRILVISPEPGAGRTLLTWSLAREYARRGMPVTVASSEPPAPPLDGLQVAISSPVCIGCMRCQQVCQHDAIELGGPGNQFVGKTYRIDPDLCVQCGDCLAQCPSNAIVWQFPATADGHAPVALLDGPAGITTRLPSLVYMVDRIVLITRPTATSLDRLPGILALLAEQAAVMRLLVNQPAAAPELAKAIAAIAAASRIRLAGELSGSSAPGDGVLPPSLADELLAG